MGLPWILMVIGEPAEMKMSEAFFSPMSWSNFSMNMRAPVPFLVAPQQFIDSRLGAGLRVDLLDDDGAVETIPPIGTGQVARYDHGARRNAPVGHLAAGAVVDLGALADVHPHRDHPPLAHDHPFAHLAAGPHEPVVLNHRGRRLPGTRHA